METADRNQLLSAITTIQTEEFDALALEVFRYQATNNPLYNRFLSLLGRNPEHISQLTEIPFLPIQFFKSHRVQTGTWEPEIEYTSSGTTGQTPSRHLVRSVDWYLQNAIRGFTLQFGSPEEWRTLALLPSYLERTGSSLVAMAKSFIELSRYPDSGFFLNDHKQLAQVLSSRKPGEKTLLLGVSFGLLDFAEQYPMDLTGVTIMETGGMKGRRKELTRPELHAVLKQAFQVEAIYSEYGMTELFSQAYTSGGLRFTASPTFKVLCAEATDPFNFLPPTRNGVLNLIDLANIDTCSFIATEDVGRVYSDGSFEILGRLDHAEMRGCNLMLE